MNDLRKLHDAFIQANSASEAEIEAIAGTIRSGTRRLSQEVIVAAYSFACEFLKHPDQARKIYGHVMVKTNASAWNQPLKVLIPGKDGSSRNRRSVWAIVFEHAHRKGITPSTFATELRLQGNIKAWKNSLEPSQISRLSPAGTEIPMPRDFCRSSQQTHANVLVRNQKYEVVYADPAWPYYGDPNKMGAAGNHYTSMSIDDIKALDVKSILAEKAVCFIWATSSTIPYVAEVMKEWGFIYNNLAWIWAKTNKDGVPMWARGVPASYIKTCNNEFLFVGSTEENGVSPFKGVSSTGASLEQLIFEPATEHSRKPDRFRDLIVELMGNRSRIELFARRPADDDWDVWGDDTACLASGKAVPRRQRSVPIDDRNELLRNVAG